MPLPVFAETVSSGTSRSCDRPSAERGLDPVEQRRRMFGDVPLVERDDQRAAFLDHLVGDAQVLRLRDRASRRAAGRRLRHNRSPAWCRRPTGARACPRPWRASAGPRCRPAAPARPFHSQSRLIESRVMPGLRAGDHPLLAEHAVDQRRLAGVRPADDRELERRVVRLLLFLGLDIARARHAAAAPRTDRRRLRHARR